MKVLKIFSFTIPLFSFLFFLGCHGKANIKNRQPPDKKQKQLVTDQINVHDTLLMVSMEFDESYLIDPISRKITSFYHIPVKHINATLPAFAFFKGRNRYKAGSLINYLAGLNNSRYRFVAGLTSKDISTTNDSIADWGIFGLGSLSAKGCVISSFRLKRNASFSLLTQRIQKVILHEIGHNYGLEHCTSPYPCFMKAANGKISEVDEEPMDMCKVCRAKINL
jgi:archaemetzincin